MIRSRFTGKAPPPFRHLDFAAVIAISSGLFVQDMRLRWLGSLRDLPASRLADRRS